MLGWRFLTYVSPHGRNDSQKTIDRYDDLAQQAFSRAIAHLAICTRDKWDEPHAKKLKGKHQLYEVRFPANRRSTRAVGFFGPAPRQFTITLICFHKANVYTPHDAINIAAKRAEQVQGGSATAAALKVDGEDFPPDDDPA